MIDCAFYGILANDAEARTSQAGKPWTRMRVGVGKEEAVQWVAVAAFGKAASVAAELKKGEKVYLEGWIKLDTWRGQDGVERHGLSVAAWRIERTHLIGKHKEKRTKRAPTSTRRPAEPAGKNDFFSDAIPF